MITIMMDIMIIIMIRLRSESVRKTQFGESAKPRGREMDTGNHHHHHFHYHQQKQQQQTTTISESSSLSSQHIESTSVWHCVFERKYHHHHPINSKPSLTWSSPSFYQSRIIINIIFIIIISIMIINDIFSTWARHGVRERKWRGGSGEISTIFFSFFFDVSFFSFFLYDAPFHFSVSSVSFFPHFFKRQWRGGTAEIPIYFIFSHLRLLFLFFLFDAPINLSVSSISYFFLPFCERSWWGGSDEDLTGSFLSIYLFFIFPTTQSHVMLMFCCLQNVSYF